MAPKSWNYTFTNLNIIFGVIGFILLFFRSVSYFAIAFAVILLFSWAYSRSKRNEIYKNATQNGWIEAEIAIYSSFAVWISVYVSAIPLEHRSDTIDVFFSIVVMLGIFGWTVSLIPLTKIFKNLR